ncbi:MAG: GTPase HflX [Treponema sp.]|jgi:GTP-binding protein HflX|nr:GTPase HflX [Treponema sp.]
MKELYDTAEKPVRALLVGIRDNAGTSRDADSLARELAGLAGTLGLEIAAQEMVHIREHSPKFGMGSGKAEELAEKARMLEIDCLVFDGELNPSQQRNWEALTGIPVVDRQELIIQIFASRARTREAELQVALAELSYSLPRLQHRHIELSRQRGGRYGTRGSGETRLETDRRLVEQRIHKLEQELAAVGKQRDVQRKQRKRQNTPSCALVGYTNAGKSSLLNALSGADVYTENKLFATLDPTTRRVAGPSGFTFLLTDTVGFIRHLPHALVRAFHSTLEEACLADLLIHVLDASDPDIDRYHETTCSVLRELGADGIPVLTVLNKIDRLVRDEDREDITRRYPDGLALSARTRSGLEELMEKIEQMLVSSQAPHSALS